MTINNEKSGELFEKYDYKNYEEDDDDDDYEIDEEDDEEDIDEYADGTISNSNTTSNTSSSERLSSKKKNKTRRLDQNLSPDEGVGDSAEMCPPHPPASTTTNVNKKKGMILASLRPDSANNTEADAYSQVITFKRTSGAKTTTTTNLDEYSSVNEISPPHNTHSGRSNMRFFRRLAGFFPNKSITPKRQQSQTSTGTTSSYLSSNYSSGDAEDLSVRRSNSGVDALLVNFEERQLLIPPSTEQQNQRSNSSSSNEETASTSPYESTTVASMMIPSTIAPNSIYNNNLTKILRTSSARNRDSDNTNSGNNQFLLFIEVFGQGLGF